MGQMKFRIGGTATAASVGLASAVLSGCGPLGGASTADLVRHGDARACAAPDVYSTLQNILTTQVDLHSNMGDLSPMFAQQLALLKQAQLKFDSTTLDTVDAATHSVDCSSELSGKIGDQTIAAKRVLYRVQPSASSGQIVVTAKNADDVQMPLMQAAMFATNGQLGSTEPQASGASPPQPPAAPPTPSNGPAAAPAATPAASSDVTHTRFGDLSVDDAQYVRLNGHRVQPAISGNNMLQLDEVFPWGDRDLVVAKDSGGTSCLEQLAVIVVDVSGAHSPGEFGTCAETEDVKRVGDHLVTSMHGFEGPSEPEAAQQRAAAERHSFIITPDGHATDNGKAAPLSPFIQP